MIRVLTIGLICICGFTSSAQQGDVKVIKDNRIDALVDKQSEIIPPEVKPMIDGYRIQLFFDSDRSLVNAARSKFVARFPKVDTYVEYRAPNFFLKAGDFRTKLEAEKVKAEVEAEYPTSFILEEKIYLPRLEKTEDID